MFGRILLFTIPNLMDEKEKNDSEKSAAVVEKEEDFPYVLMETRCNNDSANGVSKSVGCYLTTFGDRNVYLLQKSRLQEFIDTNQMEELAKHYEIENSKKAIVKQYL